jgi:hypothetical protein
MPGLILLDTDESLKGELHAMWAADLALIALHPANRLFTGRVPTITGTDTAPAPMPYTRLAVPGGSRGQRTSTTQYPTQPIEFHLWTDTAEQADSIADAIQDCFQDKDFTYDRGKVLDIHYESTNQAQITKPNYTAWETVVKFTLLTERTRTN